MHKYDLAVIIPGRNEEFQNLTIQNVCDNIEGNTQVIAVIDGEWPKEPIVDRDNLTVIRFAEPQGQRRATNLGAKTADAKYIMKLDAHCKVSKGFDRALIYAFEKLGSDIVQIPTMYNLHAFNWKCKKCGNEWYQSPTPTHCMENGESRKESSCDSTEFERVMVWKKRNNRKSECYRFDTTLHFQYDRVNMKKQTGDYIETMSAQGSCFVVSAENYFKWNICDEEWGSWGNQGTEVACKAWLSGNRLITNRKCWYAHMFRTQGGDFSFPYPQSGNQIAHARKRSRELFLDNKWEHQTRPLSWLLEKFRPMPDWHESKGKKVLDHVMKKGREFYGTKPQKGIIYYTDNQLRVKIAKKCQRQLSKASNGIKIVSSSLKPMDFGDNVVTNGKRGWITMNKQIIKALEKLDSEIVYFTEHDVFYHPSHFDFIPEKKDVFYYNTNVWKVRSMDGHAVKVDDCKQLSGLVCYKELALNHFKKRLEMLESYKGNEFESFVRKIGFEPGTHSRDERVDDFKAESFQSTHPNVDIRHGQNATATRWSPDQFRNKKYTKGWTESKDIEGWGQFKDFFGLVE